jgi:biopolymer transport protein ExbB
LDTLSLSTMLGAAGWTLLPLWLCSIVGWTVILFLGWRFTWNGVGRRRLLRQLDEPLGRRDFDAVASLARADRSPLGPVLLVALEQPSPARAEAAAQRAAVRTLERFGAGLPWLSFLAQVAPLLGLLGTVIGMVELFGVLEAAGDQVSAGALSGGIWKALLTTAAGLLVAIPMLAAHLWFRRRLDRLRVGLELAVGRLLDETRDDAARRDR